MPTKKPTTKKGKGLSKKHGPFPLYVYLGLGVVIVVGYIIYRRNKNQSSTDTGSLNQQVIPSGVVVPPSGNNAGDNSNPNGGSDASTTVPSDYVTSTDLQSAIDQLDNQIAQSVAGITFPTPVVNENITVQPAAVQKHTAATKTAAKKTHAAATAKKAPVKKPVKKPVRKPVRKPVARHPIKKPVKRK